MYIVHVVHKLSTAVCRYNLIIKVKDLWQFDVTNKRTLQKPTQVEMYWKEANKFQKKKICI